MTDVIALLDENWKGDQPEWVVELARACNATSQNKVAARLGVSATLVSLVLRDKYTGDLKGVEDLVRSELMRETVECPVLGELPKSKCRQWRDRSKDYVGTNSLAPIMNRACKSCPHNPKEQL